VPPYSAQMAVLTKPCHEYADWSEGLA